jgi:hypothetical protein
MRIEKWTTICSAFAFGLMSDAARPDQRMETTIEQMPPGLEARFALSALPPALRDKSSVYLLDPKVGYKMSKQGTSGITCIVQRTVWEMADFRNDIYIPLCYDALGTRAYLKVIMDAAALRAQGMGAADLKAEISKRWKNKTYKVPDKGGMSYMVAPLHRTISPPDMKVHTVSLPHLMPWAPGVTNQDIGAAPNLADPATLHWPFIDRQGNEEQSYLIHMVGEAEKAKIQADEKTLIDELCAYRVALCLPAGERR